MSYTFQRRHSDLGKRLLFGGLLIVALCAVMMLWFEIAPYVQASSITQPAGATVQRGLYASAPSCAGSQFIYSATDAALQGFCDGASHLDWKYKSVTVTPTVVGDLVTWYAQGGASTVSYQGSWALVGTTANDGVHGRYKTAPATPFSVVACLEQFVGSNTFATAGMFWTDGTKAITIDTTTQAGGNASGPIEINKFDNSTTFNSQYLPPNASVSMLGLFCIAMVDDGTNRKEKVSYDGKNWTQMHTVGRTDFLTANGVGVEVGDVGGNIAPQIQVVSVVTLPSAL
jgi:hypothetical protein